METNPQSTMILSNMVGTCSMAVGFLRSMIMYSLEGAERGIAEMMLRTIEGQVASAREYLNEVDPSDESNRYRAFVSENICSSLNFITTTDRAAVWKVDGGAYVEAHVFVSDSDVGGEE